MQNRLNITKTVRKFSIDRNLVVTGSEYHSGHIPHISNIGDVADEEFSDGSISLTSSNFDALSHQ